MNIYIDKRRTGFSCPHIQEKENDRTIVHVVEWEIGSKVVKNTKYSERKYFFFQHFFWKGDLQNETIANREKDWHFHNHNLDLLAKGWHPCQDAHCLCSHCTRWDQPPILPNNCAKKVLWLLPPSRSQIWATLAPAQHCTKEYRSSEPSPQLPAT